MGDALVLTPWSSFGSFAAALGKTTPWEMEGTMNIITGKCRKVLSREPCAMRAWGPAPDKCHTGRPKPLKLHANLDRRCGFDHGNAGREPLSWQGVRIEAGRLLSSNTSAAWEE